MLLGKGFLASENGRARSLIDMRAGSWRDIRQDRFRNCCSASASLRRLSITHAEYHGSSTQKGDQANLAKTLKEINESERYRKSRRRFVIETRAFFALSKGAADARAGQA